MSPRTRTASHPTHLRDPRRAIGLFLGAAVLSVLLLAPALDPGPYVPRLTLDNPTAFDITVGLAGGDRAGGDRAGGDRAGGFDIGTIGRGTEGVVEEIADPGRMWVFRFSYAGVEAGEVLVLRSDLRADGWRFAIPAEVGETLAAAGHVPSTS